jgi:hypothetical protein
VGFVVDKVTLGQVFSEYFGLPCQFSFHWLLHIHHPLSGAGTIGQLVATVSTNNGTMKKISESRESDLTRFVSECILTAQGLSADKKRHWLP